MFNAGLRVSVFFGNPCAHLVDGAALGLFNAERGVDPWSLSRALKLWGPAQGPTLNVGARINPDLAAQLHRDALDTQLAPRQGLGNERRALETLAIRLTLACAG